MSILLNSCHDEVRFFLVEELEAKRSGGELWEVDNCGICTQRNDASEHTLENENPPPSSNATLFTDSLVRVCLGRTVVLTKPGARTAAGELREAEREDSREC